MTTSLRGLDRLFLGVLLAVSATACGGDDGAGASAVSGTWTRTSSGGSAATYALNDDGTFTFDEDVPGEGGGDEHVTGTFEASDDTLVLTGISDGGERARTTTTYHLSADGFLVLSALLPDGDHDGVVGTWTGTTTIESLDASGAATPVYGGTSTFAFGADGALDATSDPFNGGPTEAKTGTYEETGPGVYRGTFPATDEQPITISITFALIDDAAIAGDVFTRVE